MTPVSQLDLYTITEGVEAAASSRETEPEDASAASCKRITDSRPSRESSWVQLEFRVLGFRV
jgi:hypothetical protein